VRLGVLDVGSRTVHPLVVDARRGGHPAPAASDPIELGVILRTRLDTLDGTAQIDRSAQDAPERLGRLTTYEARCTG
jgi:exopolyphosphatase/guanosine-5'-triphosphate,3'-diphosphate pyrophosphatase